MTADKVSIIELVNDIFDSILVFKNSTYEKWSKLYQITTLVCGLCVCIYLNIYIDNLIKEKSENIGLRVLFSIIFVLFVYNFVIIILGLFVIFPMFICIANITKRLGFYRFREGFNPMIPFVMEFDKNKIKSNFNENFTEKSLCDLNALKEVMFFLQESETDKN